MSKEINKNAVAVLPQVVFDFNQVDMKLKVTNSTYSSYGQILFNSTWYDDSNTTSGDIVENIVKDDNFNGYIPGSFLEKLTDDELGKLMDENKIYFQQDNGKHIINNMKRFLHFNILTQIPPTAILEDDIDMILEKFPKLYALQIRKFETGKEALELLNKVLTDALEDDKISDEMKQLARETMPSLIPEDQITFTKVAEAILESDEEYVFNVSDLLNFLIHNIDADFAATNYDKISKKFPDLILRVHDMLIENNKSSVLPLDVKIKRGVCSVEDLQDKKFYKTYHDMLKDNPTTDVLSKMLPIALSVQNITESNEKIIQYIEDTVTKKNHDNMVKNLKKAKEKHEKDSK